MRFLNRSTEPIDDPRRCCRIDLGSPVWCRFYYFGEHAQEDAETDLQRIRAMYQDDACIAHGLPKQEPDS